ncbi:hypothetical protein Metev_2366 (plasmid) [Methanohalobium evestigatum Z-7303]|uniref:Uncharacterized protein n=1 Tax=Methanohalobium evestigatum (strain ATCC BAA-1072 / DSM 3721 / NBRC 107634 / OCM 161 / Z-7303) TaxID=644295 RepID=D7EC54_METEZ|nr:surface glycoprotein [Methanohalobium evestigatum]ADI75176.1 hypothetical protein Metev_2366 [Methanohalobium evestigatum Z-7303]
MKYRAFILSVLMVLSVFITGIALTATTASAAGGPTVDYVEISGNEHVTHVSGDTYKAPEGHKYNVYAYITELPLPNEPALYYMHGKWTGSDYQNTLSPPENVYTGESPVLSPGTYSNIKVTVEQSGTDTASATLEVKETASSILNLNAPEKISAGDSATVQVDIENTGGIQYKYNTVLSLDSSSIKSKTTESVAKGGSTKLSITIPESETENLESGTHTITVETLDNDGEGDTTTSQVEVIVDQEPPDISNVTIDDDDDGNDVVATGDTVTLSADVSDASAISSVTFDASDFDAGTVQLSGSGNGTYTTDIDVGSSPTEGNQSVTVSSMDEHDNGGSQAEPSNSLTVDNTKPDISNVNITDETDGNGNVTANDSVNITANVSDANGIKSVTADANSFGLSSQVSLTNNGDGTYTKTITVNSKLAKLGSQSLTVSATDEADNGGLQNVESDKLTIDVPHITETITRDNDGNGKTDNVTIKFSEDVNLNDGSSDGIPGLTLDNSNMGITSKDYSASGDQVTVELSSEVDNTASTTNVTYDSTAGNIVTTNGYEITEDMSSVTKTDGANPVISDFTATNPSGQSINIKFNSSEELSIKNVSITGPENVYLNSGFSTTENSAPYEYTATCDTITSDGDYTAELIKAVDFSGNDGASGESDSVIVDSIAPSLDSAEQVDSTSIYVVLSDSNAGIDKSTIDQGDFSLSAGEISSIEKSSIDNGDTSGTVTINLQEIVSNDTITVNLQEDGIADMYGNTRSEGSAEATGMDSFAPTLDEVVGVDKTTIDVTFSDSGSGLDRSTIDLGDFSLSAGEIFSIDKSGINDGDESGTVTINLNDTVNVDNITVSLQSDGIDDLNGNTLSSGSVEITGMEGFKPTLEDANKVDLTTINVTFMDSGTGLNKSSITKSDFSLNTKTDFSIDVSDINNGENRGNVTINLNNPVDTNTVNVSLQNDGIEDMSNNTINDGSSEVSGMDGVSPTLNESANKIDDDTIELKFSDNGTGLDESTISSGDFLLSVGKIASISTTSVIDGDNSGIVTIDLAEPVDNESIIVSFKSNSDGIDDMSGNTLTSGSAEVTGMDHVAPTLDSGNSLDKTTIYVALSDSGTGLDNGTIDKNDFSLSTGVISSIEPSITSGDTSGTVTINLENKVDAENVTVTLVGSINDMSNNNNILDSGSVEVTEMDGVAPTLNSVDKQNLTAIDVDFIDSGTGIDESTIDQGDFSLSAGDISSIDKSGIINGDTSGTVTINLKNKVNADTVTVSLQKDGIDDISGNTRSSDSAEVSGMDGVPPTINEFNVTDPDVKNQNVSIEINSSEKLATIGIDLDIDELGDKLTLDKSNFTKSGDGPYIYTATYEGSVDGKYTATLNTADDAAGNDGASGETYSDSVSIDTTPPEINGFKVNNPTGREINVTINTSEELSTINVGLDGKTFDENDFSLDSNAPYIYTHTYSAGSDGDYTATLNTAKDAAGNDGASSETDDVFIDTIPPGVTSVSGTTVEGGNDRVTIEFNESVIPTDNTWSENEIGSLESPQDTTVPLTNAEFSYSTQVLNITLSENNDAYLKNGNDGLAVTLNNDNISDGSSNHLDSSQNIGTVEGDSDVPGITDANITSDDIVLDSETGTSLDVTINFDEKMDDSTKPTVEITGLTQETTDLSSVNYADSTTLTGTVEITDNDEDTTGSIVVTDAEDLAGNTNSPSESFTVDTQEPKPSINSLNTPLSGNVTLSSTDNTGDSVSSITWKFSTDTSSGTYSEIGTGDSYPWDTTEQVTDEDSTNNGLKVIYRDDAGNINSSTITGFEIDNLKPGISSASITNAPINVSDVGDTQTVTLNFNESMNTSVSPSVQITGTNKTYSVEESSYSDSVWEGTVTIDDDNEDLTAEINVSGAEDLAGNVMADDASNTFTVDTQEPEPTTSIDNKNLSETVDVASYFTINSDDIYSTTFEYGSNKIDEANESSWDSTKASDGDIDFTLTAEDDAGNTGTVTGTATVDNTEPVINEFKVTDPDVENQNISIEVNSSEQLATIGIDLDIDEEGDEAALDLNNFTKSGDGPYIYTATYEGSKDGTYNATLTDAKDYAENNGAYNQNNTTVIDTTNPEITDIGPNKLTDNNQPVIGFNLTEKNLDTLEIKIGNVSDNNKYLNWTDIDLSGTQNPYDEVEFTFDPAAHDVTLNDGEVIVNVSATDTKSNTQTKEWSFEVDTKAPDLKKTYPINDINNNQSVISFNLTEPNLDTLKIQIGNESNNSKYLDWNEFDLSGTSNPYNNVKFTIDPEKRDITFEEGQVVVNVSANDTNSNKMNKKWNFTIDKTTPEVEYSVINSSLSTRDTTYVEVKFNEAIDKTKSDISIETNGHILSFEKAIESNILIFSNHGTLINSKEDKVTGLNNISDNASNFVSLNDEMEIDVFRRTIDSSSWNYVSFPIADDNKPKITKVMEKSDGYTIWKYHDHEWQVYKPGDMHEFTGFEGGLGYMVSSEKDFILSPNINTIYENDLIVPATVEVYDGWNLIGYYEEYRGSDNINQLDIDTYKSPHSKTPMSTSTGEVIWVSLYDLSNGSANYNSGERLGK